MKPEDVPAEWAEHVAMALTNAYCRGALGSEPYTDLDVWRSVSGYERFMADARAAIAAAIRARSLPGIYGVDVFPEEISQGEIEDLQRKIGGMHGKER